MKNSIIILILLLTTLGIHTQNMTWIPSDYSNYGGCENLTNCDQNIVCYKLQYTPLTDGVLTSYTTGFFADCQEGETSLLENQSCLMQDNSRQIEACHQVGKILMNCSANSGSGDDCRLEANVPIILHQVCFQVANGNHITITEDTKTDLTTSTDIIADGNYYGKTEFPTYQIYETKNEQICDHSPNDINIGAHEYDDRVTELHWTPAGETGSGNYVIERSFGGDKFEKIDQTTDRNFDINELSYKLYDETAQYGYNYYQVVYTDNQGKETRSNIGSVYHFNGEFSVNVYPNPVEDDLQAEVNCANNGFSWSLVNETGNIILQGKENQSRYKSFDMRRVPTGVYFLNIQSGEQTISKKILKIK